MAKEKIDALVEGGKASAAPPLGPALGPLGVNIGEVVNTINEKTKEFKGMKVPVKVIVDSNTKEFEVEVGTPPVSQLIKKELGLKSGSGIPNKDKVGNMAIEQVIKVAKMKQDSMFINNLKSAVKTVIGSANAMGLLIEGKTAVEINKEIDKGKYDKEINEEKTEIPEEKKAVLKEQLDSIQKSLEKDREAIKAKVAKKEAKEEKAGGKEEKKEEGKEAAEPKEEKKE